MPKTRKRQNSAIPSYERTEATSGADYSHDRIAARAYELYLARGGEDGMAIEDWLAAERELSTAPPGETGK
jgi:DUF2934 family protein